MALEPNGSLARPGKSASLWKKTRYFFSRIPGTKKDHFFLTIVLIDLFFFLLISSYGSFFPDTVLLGFLIYDFIVVTIWGVNLVHRYRTFDNKFDFVQSYWYEILGVLPFNFFRPFLLLRALKNWIAYIKLFGNEKDVSKLNTVELTFRFRDIILDSISDAVFLRSLDRVEEVMVQLDYSSLSKSIIEKYEEELLYELNQSMKSKEIVGALARIPLLNKISQQMSEDFATVFKEVLETEVMGNIMKEFTRAIMSQMASRVKNMESARIVGESTNANS